jgi:hypothetical protein
MRQKGRRHCILILFNTTNRCQHNDNWRAPTDDCVVDVGGLLRPPSEFELNVEVGTVLNTCPPVVSCGVLGSVATSPM